MVSDEMGSSAVRVYTTAKVFPSEELWARMKNSTFGDGIIVTP